MIDTFDKPEKEKEKKKKSGYLYPILACTIENLVILAKHCTPSLVIRNSDSETHNKPSRRENSEIILRLRIEQEEEEEDEEPEKDEEEDYEDEEDNEEKRETKI